MSSTSINPLMYFEDFFPEGFDKLYNRYFFIGVEFNTQLDRMRFAFPYQQIVEISITGGYVLRRTIHDGSYRNMMTMGSKTIKLDADAPPEKRFYFKDELEATLKPQIDIAIKQTISNIQLRGEDEQRAYMHSLLTEVEYIVNNKLKQISAIKYEAQCKVYLIHYLREIVQRYNYLVKKDASYMKLLNESVENDFITLMIVPHKQDLIPKLYNKLVPKFIDENTSLDTFTKAFTGVQLREGESLGIKWVLNPHGNSYIGALVVMLDYMVAVGCLNKYNDKQLSNIFITDKGSYIIPSNWSKRRAQANSPKKRGEPLIFRELRGIIDTTII